VVAASAPVVITLNGVVLCCAVLCCVQLSLSACRMLNDLSAGVRLAALKAVCELYETGTADIRNRLTPFIERFLKRFLEMTTDVDRSVRTHGMAWTDPRLQRPQRLTIVSYLVLWMCSGVAAVAVQFLTSLLRCVSRRWSRHSLK
jgi:hypothetical protein